MITIEKWSDPGQVAEITRLLHTSYAPLAAAGMRYLASHQGEEITLERLSKGESYIAIEGRLIVGTISLSLPGQVKHHVYFDHPDVCVFNQLAVRHDRQGEGIGGMLMDLVERRAAELGASVIACDTSELAKDLIGMYRRRGYGVTGEADWDMTNYRSVILGKILAKSR